MLVPPSNQPHPTPPLSDTTAAAPPPRALVASTSTLHAVPIQVPVAVDGSTLVSQVALTAAGHPPTVAVLVSPALSAGPVHSTPPAVSSSPDNQVISPASSSASSDSSASSHLSAPSSEDVLSASSSSSSASSSLSSSDTSHVSSVSTIAMSGSTTTITALAERQRAHVAESAYQALLLNIKALSEHVAAVQSANTVSDQVKQRLEETLARANKGWKKIKTERKKRRKKKHMTKERTMKQEEQQSVQHETVAAAAPHHIVSDTTNQLGAVNPPSSSAQQGGVVGGSNILQAMSFGNEEVGRKRRQLSDSSTADTTVDEEAEEDEDDDEEEEAAAQDVSPPLAFKAMPPLAVMSLTSPVSVPPNASTPVSLTPNAPSSSIPPSAAASYQSSSSTDGVSDAQAPVVMSCSKFPIAVLNVPVQRQYTMTRRDSKRMKRADKEALVNVTVRIMGTPDRAHIYFVAKDVCQLICLRKGSVAKAIHDFSATEKARMPVLCQRSSGSGCTQVLTVLTMAGVQRLMTSSRQPIARSVLQWLSERVGEIQAGQMPSTAFDPNATLQPADSTHSQPAAPSQQQPVVASDPTTILFPPQPSQLPSAPSGMSLYQQYGLSDMMVDAPVSPQIGFAGTRPSLSMTNFPQFPLPSQPGGHSLTSVSQFANHAFLGPTSMSLPSFSPVSSFGSSTSSYSLPGVAQLQPPTQLHSQQLLPVSYPSILSQLIGSSASTSPAFSTAHQPQSNSAGHLSVSVR